MYYDSVLVCNCTLLSYVRVGVGESTKPWYSNNKKNTRQRQLVWQQQDQKQHTHLPFLGA